ncbi:MAG: 2-phosphosulfolactate phosphatase [Gemmatimonadota bacterium]
MNAITYLSAAEAESGDFEGRTAVVIDVIRATSTIVEALAAGAKAVYPTLATEDAIRIANSLGRDEILLCGERKGLMVPGFDLGNSPGEFVADRVEGMRLVMSTTNGTRAFLAAEDADRVLAAAFLNLSAVARSLQGAEKVAFVCAGRDGHFSLDDALCAGLLLQELLEGVEEDARVLDDASRAVLALARSFPLTPEFLQETAAGAALVEVGLAADLLHCAERDRYDLVPEMQDRMIRLTGRAR